MCVVMKELRTHRPQSQEVVEGDNAEFVCSVSKDTYKVKWLKTDKELEAGDKYDLIHDGKIRTLIVKNCLLKDRGPYVALIGSTKASADLSVIEKLRILTPLKDIQIMEGQEIVFNCEVNTEGAKAKWLKDDEIIFESGKFIMAQKDNVFSLRIKDTQKSDEANYTITLTNQRGEHVRSSANLSVQEEELKIVESLYDSELIISEAPTDFITDLKDQTVTEFEDAEFSCQISKEKTEVRWYKDGRELKEGLRYHMEKDGKTCILYIKDCRPDDECEYACGIPSRRSRARLFVEEIPVEIIRPPINISEPPGSDVEFEVELNKDRVEIKWLRNNMIIVQGDKYQMMSEGKVHRLQICEIRPRDQGEYRVIARDKDARAKLELAAAPKIKTTDQNLVTDAGTPLVMTVPYNAYPEDRGSHREAKSTTEL
ncbi:titin-like [Arapaima gigas]